MAYLVRLISSPQALPQGEVIINKYIFFDPTDLSQINNENIVYQLNLDINESAILDFINYLTGGQRLPTCIIRKGLFHADLKSCQKKFASPSLCFDKKNPAFNDFYTSFRIGSRDYHFYEIGIDIHLNKCKKNGYIDHGNIEIKYKAPNIDPRYSQDNLRDSMIVLNFHITLSNANDFTNVTRDFLSQLNGYVGVGSGYFRAIPGETDIIQLESININNYSNYNFTIADESQIVRQTVLSYKGLQDSKKNLEKEKSEMLQFFKEKMKKTNNAPLTFQFNDIAITEEKFIERFPDCRIQ